MLTLPDGIMAQIDGGDRRVETLERAVVDR
jgi:hypothetical protein